MLENSDKTRRLPDHTSKPVNEPNRADVLNAAKALDPLQLTSLQVRRITRQLRTLPPPADLRIAYAGNVTLEPLSQYAEASFACSGLVTQSYVSAFGQAQQELLNPSSALRTFRPDFVFFHFDVEALRNSFPAVPVAAATEVRLAELEELLSRVTSVVRAALEHMSATILVTNFVAPDTYALGLSDSRAELGEAEFFARLNSECPRQQDWASALTA